ncbi:MAG: hypothetical protein NC489_36300 [Ruminococcus flavefaciens]|nr:hypothetical protein [Ruminococcus flavefaciens]
MAKNKTSWFFESASERKNSDYEPQTSSFGAYQKEGEKSFNERFEELCEQYRETASIDIKKNLEPMLSDRHFMEQYKTDLISPIAEAFHESSTNDPHINAIVDNVNRFWDTKVKSYTESASITQFLPIATLEFPVLVKQFFSSILKDIIEVESVKTPNIVKHVRTTFMVDNQTGEEYEYPKCLFDGTWEKIWDASKGIKLSEDVVPLTNGRLWKFDLCTIAPGSTSGVDQLSYQFKIIGLDVGGEKVMLPGNGITVEFSTNGTLVNGDLKFTTPNGVEVEDTISGQVDFRHATISLSCAKGDQITGVIFHGYMSNERNERSASVREKRDILRFTIEDGARWNMPFSIEEIEDAAALLDINYYNRMVDEITRTQEMNECMTVIKFLNDEFKKFNGVQTDTFKLESMAQTHYVSMKPPAYFAGDPFKYVSSVIQFRLKNIIHQITDDVKQDDLSFVIVGNPRVTQLITEFVKWKSQTGSSIGGISVNNSYGFATDMGANVRVVATNLYDAYTADPVKDTGKREMVLHIYVYPTDSEHISFRHLKYTSHLMTSQSQTAYQSPGRLGGAYNIVTATSRFHTMSVQGIQADLIITDSEELIGPAPKRPPVTGAPWEYEP